MKPYRFFVSILSIVTLFSCNYPTDALSYQQNIAGEEKTESTPPLITEEQKKRLQENAGRLSDEFLTLFKDTTGITSEVSKKMIHRISEWIRVNYPKISAEKRQKIDEFIALLLEKYKDIESLSLETLDSLMGDLQEFMEKMEKDEAPEETFT